VQWVGSAMFVTLVTFLGSTSVQLDLFFFRADDRCERGMAPLQVKWRGVAPHGLTGRHGNGNGTAPHVTFLGIAPSCQRLGR
jgi:hypothetical protein